MVASFAIAWLGVQLGVWCSSATASNPVEIENQGCESKSGGYLDNSPGIVPNIGICKDLCQESTQCNSITMWGNDFCSHFSTACPDLFEAQGATTVRLQPQKQNANWVFLAPYGIQCDFGHGEVYLSSSSGKVGSLSECLDNCEASKDCKSVTFYENNFCSHVSTSCTKTIVAKNAVAFRKLETATTLAPTTTPAPTPAPTTTATPTPAAPGWRF